MSEEIRIDASGTPVTFWNGTPVTFWESLFCVDAKEKTEWEGTGLVTPSPLAFGVHRAKVAGGWLLVVVHYSQVDKNYHSGGITFYPDSTHEWTGGSLPL